MSRFKRPRPEPPRPVLPLQVYEYAIMGRKMTRVFSRNAPVWGEKWGVLYCLDQEGARWTAWGSHSYVRALRGAAEKASAEQRAQDDHYSPAADWNGYVVNEARLSEFPIEAFEARWVCQGWADEWPQMKRVVFIRMPS